MLNSTALLLLIAFTCGSLIPIHAGMNSALSGGLGSPIAATILSFGVSFFCLIGVSVIFRPSIPSFSSIASIPTWAWLAGVVGVIYVITTMLLVPRLGAVTFIAVVVAGQMTMAMLVDHYGLLGLQHRSVDFVRVIGGGLVVVGVVVMQLNVSD